MGLSFSEARSFSLSSLSFFRRDFSVFFPEDLTLWVRTVEAEVVGGGAGGCFLAAMASAGASICESVVREGAWSCVYLHYGSKLATSICCKTMFSAKDRLLPRSSGS